MNIVDYVKTNPGCSLVEVIRDCNVDAGDVINADRTRSIEMKREDDGWHFYPKAGVG